MINIKSLNPITKPAALVAGKGFEYKPNKKVQTIESNNPLPTRLLESYELSNKNIINCAGIRMGRLTVIGRHIDSKGWVCRCDCSTYCVRTQKAVLNKNNTQDRCEECRHLAFLKKDEKHRRTGKDVDINDY